MNAAGLTPKITIRNAGSVSDWEMVREICCRTANAGEPIENSRWGFFGEYWVGPYERRCSRWTYLAEKDGAIIGYLTGCPDTAKFRKGRLFSIQLPLISEILLRQYPWNGDIKRFIRRAFLFSKGPEDRFSKGLYRRLKSDYPAHLHINILSGHRSGGIGKLLIDQFVTDLKDLDTSPRPGGIHLFCDDAPVKFYQRNGFELLESVTLKSGLRVHALGRLLA